MKKQCRGRERDDTSKDMTSDLVWPLREPARAIQRAQMPPNYWSMVNQ
jgi:hypothetical protein